MGLDIAHEPGRGGPDWVELGERCYDPRASVKSPRRGTRVRRPTPTSPDGDGTTRISRTPASRSELAAVLVVLRGPEVGERVSVRSGPLRVGRGPDVDFRLTDPDVAPRHFAIVPTMRPDRWTLVDLGAGATHVGGALLPPMAEREVRERDEIVVGSTVLRLELHDPVEQEFDRTVLERLHLDELTGLLSRRKLERELAIAVAEGASDGREHGVVVALVDIDGLKRINDSHGHLAGSAVIAHVGRIVARRLGDRGVAGRIGGDEIAMILRAPLADALITVESVLRAVRLAPCDHEGTELYVTVSAGVAQHIPAGTGSAPAELGLSLLRAADEALLEAKRAGGDRIVIAP